MSDLFCVVTLNKPPHICHCTSGCVMYNLFCVVTLKNVYMTFYFRVCDVWFVLCSDFVNGD